MAELMWEKLKRGYATETARAMLGWANREHGVRHFVSGVAPDNRPSLRVIEKLGFTPTGIGDDGELIFELRFGQVGSRWAGQRRGV